MRLAEPWTSWTPPELATVDAVLERAPVDEPGADAIVTVCAWCEKVRSLGDHWAAQDVARPARGDAETSHGVCLECAEAFLLSSDVERLVN